MDMGTILVIDDDIELCELLSEYLQTEGFRIHSIHNGAEGAQEALTGNYSLIILDVMLPGMGGFDVLRTIRSEKNTPILMLTARGDDIDRIVGLEMGADDYLPKPYNPRELLARIRAILRRLDTPRTESAKPDVLAVGNLNLHHASLSATLDGENLHLTVVEFNLLELLAKRAGSVVQREEIAETVLGRPLQAYDRSIDVHISNLRKKLGDHESIKSIRGAGYMLTVGGTE